jgi:hypothetical protein
MQRHHNTALTTTTAQPAASRGLNMLNGSSCATLLETSNSRSSAQA